MLYFVPHLVRMVWGLGMATAGSGTVGSGALQPLCPRSRRKQSPVFEAGPGQVPLAHPNVPLALHVVEFGNRTGTRLGTREG